MRGLLPVVCLLTACAPAEPPAPERSAPRPALVHEVASAPAQVRHRFIGRVEAMQTVDLSFEVPGPLATLNVREGERVTAGTVVAALDPVTYELAVRQARAQLELARLDLERKRQLLSNSGTSRAVVDEAATVFELREVALAQAAEALDDTRIVAPFDAYIAQRHTDPGKNVGAGEPILRLLDLRALKIVASVREDLLATVDAARVRAQYAEFAFLPDRSFSLTYLENRGEADPVAQTYEIGFSLPYPDDVNLLPGMTASVIVELGAPPGAAPEIPLSALIADADRTRGFFVWRLAPGSDRVERRPIKIGPLAGPTVPVLDGLAPGDRIVTAGAAHLADGMQVRPLSAP